MGSLGIWLPKALSWLVVRLLRLASRLTVGSPMTSREVAVEENPDFINPGKAHQNTFMVSFSKSMQLVADDLRIAVASQNSHP